MTITERLIDHRILIVLDPATGTLIGAHEDRLTEILNGDQRIGVSPSNGVPLNPISLAAALPTQATLMAQVQALTAQFVAAQTATMEAVAARDAALERVAALEIAAEAATAARVGEVTNYQIRAALIGDGLFDAVNTYMLSLPPADLARQGWEYGNTFLRSSDFVVSLTPLLAQLLAITIEQASAKLDALFASASAVTG